MRYEYTTPPELQAIKNQMRQQDLDKIITTGLSPEAAESVLQVYEKAIDRAVYDYFMHGTADDSNGLAKLVRSPAQRPSIAPLVRKGNEP